MGSSGGQYGAGGLNGDSSGPLFGFGDEADLLYGNDIPATDAVDPMGFQGGAHPWNYPANTQLSVLRDSSDAMFHYFNGNGETIGLSDAVKQKIINHPNIEAQIEKNINGEGVEPYRIAINFTLEGWDVFHIGRTLVSYTEVCSSGSCTTTFTAPIFDESGAPDRFEEPLNINGLEVLGGVPYDYETFEWSVTYPEP
ncbi:hypothetical protein OR573_01205 [Halomonas sp. CH40]